jgi:hypothetical protein
MVPEMGQATETALSGVCAGGNWLFCNETRHLISVIFYIP